MTGGEAAGPPRGATRQLRYHQVQGSRPLETQWLHHHLLPQTAPACARMLLVRMPEAALRAGGWRIWTNALDGAV